MSAYILTGAPGSGKTAILRMLETVGYLVVEEAATDVIALENALGCDAPWEEPSFTDKIVALQRQRQERALAGRNGQVVFFDRSPVCTLALSRYLGFASPTGSRSSSRPWKPVHSVSTSPPNESGTAAVRGGVAAHRGFEPRSAQSDCAVLPVGRMGIERGSVRRRGLDWVAGGLRRPICPVPGGADWRLSVETIS